MQQMTYPPNSHLYPVLLWVYNEDEDGEDVDVLRRPAETGTWKQKAHDQANNCRNIKSK